MKIVNSLPEDIDFIFKLYRIASEYQKTRFPVIWPEFERSLVETEIADNRQWKMLNDQGEVICIWATTFDDPLIWEERNIDPAIYIHRIATNPDCRGQKLVKKIVDWAKDYAKTNQKQYIRLDTIDKNTRLIEHYTSCGFDYLGLFKLKNSTGLPLHYLDASVSLFEISLSH